MKKLDRKNALQVVVNTGNVIIYAANNNKECGLPSSSCYDKVGNIHKILWYEPKTDEELTVIFLVKALDNC